MQDIVTTDISVDLRRGETGDIYRLQDRIRMGFTINAVGIAEIVGPISIGPSFSNDWVSIVSNTSSNGQQALAFRNIYLRKVMGKTSVEAGALSPEAVVGAAGLAPSGWLDGVQIKTVTQLGDFKVVAGSLGSFSNPDAFSRYFNGNFLEVEMGREGHDHLIVTAVYENLDGDHYSRPNIRYD